MVTDVIFADLHEVDSRHEGSHLSTTYKVSYLLIRYWSRY